MSIDSWAVMALAGELRHAITPGRIQQVLQVDESSVALELYAGRVRRTLLLSADPQAPRAYLTEDKQRRGVDAPSPFLQLARKYLRGGRLIDVVQPPWERILDLHVDHPELGRSRVVVELIGRWANVLLLRPVAGVDGAWRVLEALHHRRDDGRGRRANPPGHLYQPPPALEGAAPDALDPPALTAWLAEADDAAPLWRVWVENVAGFSPQAARELVYRSTGSTQTPVREARSPATQAALLGALAQWLDAAQAGAWQPCVVFDDAGSAARAFAPYWLSHYPPAQVQAMSGISQAVEHFCAARSSTPGDAYAVARGAAAAALARGLVGLQRREEALARQQQPAEQIAAWRAAGEWILALSSQIAPRQSRLALPAGVEMEPVALDPTLTPAENAAVYFKRYRKARRAAEMAGPRLEALAAERRYLQQLEADLALAADRNEIDAVRAALVEAGIVRARRGAAALRAPTLQGPRRFTSAEGFPILVGRNSRQNEQLTFEVAGPEDVWLHARGWPGAHVVIRSGGAAVSEDTVRQAAALAAFYSKAQREASVDVIVATRRRVQRAPGPRRPGMVTVDGERVVRVRPQPAL